MWLGNCLILVSLQGLRIKRDCDVAPLKSIKVFIDFAGLGLLGFLGSHFLELVEEGDPLCSLFCFLYLPISFPLSFIPV